MPTLQKGLIFIQLQTEKRVGCKEDKESIMETFLNHFQSEVILWENYTGMQIEAEFEKMLRDSGWLDKFESCEFVAVFSLCYGDIEGQILLADDFYEAKPLLLYPLFKFRQLAGKLKWLINQSSRGRITSVGDYEFDNGSDEGIYEDYHYISHCTAESTLSNQILHEDGNNGNIFIQTICAESCRGNITTSVGDYEFDNGGDKKTYEETYEDYHYISNCTAESTLSNQILHEDGNNGNIFIQTICAELKKNSYSLTLDEMLDNVKDDVVVSLKKDIVTLVDKKLMEMSTALRAIFTDDNNKKKKNLPSDDLWQRVRECVYKCVNKHVKYNENTTLNGSVRNEVELYLSDNSRLEEILNNVSEAVRPCLMEIYVRSVGISTPTYQKSCADEHKFWKE